MRAHSACVRPGKPLFGEGFTQIAALALAFLSLAAACAPEDPAGAAPHPLAAEPTKLEFPRIPMGRSATGEFRLRNQGGAELVLDRIGPFSCGCASAVLRVPDGAGGLTEVPLDREGRPGGQRVRLSPGAEAVVEVTIDTTRLERRQSRTIGSFLVEVAGHPTLVLEYAADVWTPFVVEPWVLDLGEVGVRERATGVVGLQAHDEAEFFPLVPEQQDGWEFHLDGGGSRQSGYRILVRAPAELPLGPFQERFEFPVDLEDAPPVSFMVQGVAAPDVIFAPPRLVLRPTDTGEGFAARGRVRTRAESGRLEVADVWVDAADSGRFELRIEPEPDGRGAQVVLVWRAAAPDRDRAGKVVLRTNDPESPQVEIPFLLPAAQPE